ncbi:MAG: hypothetical protein Q8M29_03645 [Bacteroidota bacterium]|nr:hypothetical protein [Bacteroidota bacterium]
MKNKGHNSNEKDFSKKNRIAIHENLDIAAEQQAEYIANQTPAERIRETVELIKRVYSYTGPKKENSNKIYIDKE